jgi:hypothetical protein
MVCKENEKDVDGWSPPFTFPTPANGSQYLPSEVISLLVDSQLQGRKHAGNIKQYLITNDLVAVETVNAIGEVMRNTGGDPLKAPACLVAQHW